MAGQDEFQERMARVRSLQEQRAADMRSSRRRGSAGREIVGNAAYPLSFVGAFLLGILAVGLGSFIRFHVANGAVDDQLGDISLLITGVFGMATSFILAQMFRLRSKPHLSLQSLGVFAAVCTIHNIFHWFPGPTAFAYSPEHVAMMQEITPPNSAVFRGMVFTFRAESETAPASAAPGPAHCRGSRGNEERDDWATHSAGSWACAPRG